MDSAAHDQTACLIACARGGDVAPEKALLGQLYRELHALAEHGMRRARPDHALPPTALAREAWLRMVHGPGTPEWKHRAHFLGVAAETRPDPELAPLLLEAAAALARP